MKNSVFRQCDDPIRPLGTAKRRSVATLLFTEALRWKMNQILLQVPLAPAPTVAATACNVPLNRNFLKIVDFVPTGRTFPFDFVTRNL